MPDHLANWAKNTKPVKKARTSGKILERDIQRAIVRAFLVKYRIVLFHADSGGAGMRSGLSEGVRAYTSLPAGFPDLLGVIPGGRALFVEVKRPGNKPTDLQTRFLESFRLKGAVAFWADSVESALQQFEEQHG